MHYLFNKDWKFIWTWKSSEWKIKSIDLNLNTEDKEKILNWSIYIDWSIIETEEYKNFKIKKIRIFFQEKYDEYFNKYDKWEQEQFANKIKFAEKVLEWWESHYITTTSQRMGITSQQFAELIISKKNEAEIFYTQIENERDAAINALINV